MLLRERERENGSASSTKYRDVLFAAQNVFKTLSCFYSQRHSSNESGKLLEASKYYFINSNSCTRIYIFVKCFALNHSALKFLHLVRNSIDLHSTFVVCMQRFRVNI